MNVYLTTSKKSLFYAYPAIHSFFKENQDSEVYLYIVSEDLEEADIVEEQKLADRYGHKICILHFDEEKAKEKVVAKNPEHWPLGTLGIYWLFHELLPEDVDRILAIEADTVTVGSVRDCYESDLDGFYAACPDAKHKPESHKELMKRLGGDTLTFVMSLYNVKKIREDFTLDEILRTDAYVVEKFGHSQQELTFGILFKGKINFMDPQTSCVEENRQAMGELGYDYIKSCEETCPMLHFSSFIEKEKPWNPVCVMPGYARWWEYAEESPYHKRYIEEQWKIFDYREEKIKELEKNISYKNILFMTLFVSILFNLIVIGNVSEGVKIIFGYITAFLITMAVRKILIWRLHLRRICKKRV
ncbi:MAG: glycosyltransferase family 8 protein [Eisenbergiella sp.]